MARSTSSSLTGAATVPRRFNTIAMRSWSSSSPPFSALELRHASAICTPSS